MTATITVTLNCDTPNCGNTYPTTRNTVTGARGDAERAGWRVSTLAGGRHTKKSSDPARRDECPHHTTTREATLL